MIDNQDDDRSRNGSLPEWIGQKKSNLLVLKNDMVLMEKLWKNNILQHLG